MRRAGTIALALAAGLAASTAATPASAQRVFDMRGTWTGMAEAIVDGPANHHPPPGAAGIRPAGRFRLSQQQFTIEVIGQEGRRFWGTTASSTKRERIIGSLAVDNRTVHMVDDDGMLDGTVVDADTLEICYRHVNKDSAVVACARMTRKP